MFDHRSKLDPSARLAEINRAEVLLAEIGSVEEQIAALRAQQLMLTAEVVESCRVLEFGRASRSSTSSQTAVAMQVAAARRVSLAAAERYIVDAERLVGDLPRVFAVLEAGLSTLEAVRAVAAEAVNVPFDLVDQLDQMVADDLLEVPVTSQARMAARRRAYELNPDAAQHAAELCRRERFVTVRPSIGVGTAALTAVLPAEQAEHCHAVLTHHANLIRHDGDERTISQIMADTLVERITGQTTASAVPVSVGLLMNLTTLLGADDTPAHLPGHGPLPAPVARMLATTDTAWLRRLLTDPIDATIATADTQRRRFDSALRDLCLARDQHCRAPGCTSRITHLDHNHPHTDHGPTTASNGRGYNTHCHTVKHHPDVITYTYTRTDATHAAYTRWKLPIGPPLASLPPPALGPGSTTQTQNHNRRTIHQQLTC